ncbi:MAG TPA: hypothetical protein VHV82_10785 [Sporichthyaceae bacterium]|jgi:hypothetical protein|nr:hypothetical protein [Sporichthyaceae bacterium]
MHGYVAGLVVAAVAGGLVMTGPPRAIAAQAPGDAGSAGATISICNRSGYMFNVYADGPSVREDDLAGFSKGGECSDWPKVLPGGYQIGFGLRTAGGGTNGAVVVHARFRRNNHVFYKAFNNEGVISTTLGPGDNVQLDLEVPQA